MITYQFRANIFLRGIADPNAALLIPMWHCTSPCGNADLYPWLFIAYYLISALICELYWLLIRMITYQFRTNIFLRAIADPNAALLIPMWHCTSPCGNADLYPWLFIAYYLISALICDLYWLLITFILLLAAIADLWRQLNISELNAASQISIFESS